jgi:hypothetical protein
MTVKTSNVICDSYFNKCTAVVNYGYILWKSRGFGRKRTGLNCIMRNSFV